MSDLQIEEEVEIRTITIDADSVCHIDDGSGMKALCGCPTPEGLTCPLYSGEALCPGCGLATCPKCIVLSDLENRVAD